MRQVQADDDDLEFQPRELPPLDALGGQADPDSAKPQEPCLQTYRQRSCCEEGKECEQAWRQIESNLLKDFNKDFLDITPLFKPDVSYRTAAGLNQAKIRAENLSISARRGWKNSNAFPLYFEDGKIIGLEGDNWAEKWKKAGRDVTPPKFEGRVVEYKPDAESVRVRQISLRSVERGNQSILVEVPGEIFTLELAQLSPDDHYWLNGRPWRDLSGRLIAHGWLDDYKWGRIYIRNRKGDILARPPLRELGNDELCYVDAYWGEGVGLPTQCRLQGTPEIRNFALLTYTWKASALCHKPLYFEEVQLERYGHSAGPLAQPIISGAHFFGNIAVLPYKMGLHPPTECVYALGYFRPGSCAPYMIPPVPFSVRAGLMQAGAVVGAAAILP